MNFGGNAMLFEAPPGTGALRRRLRFDPIGPNLLVTAEADRSARSVPMTLTQEVELLHFLMDRSRARLTVPEPEPEPVDEEEAAAPSAAAAEAIAAAEAAT